MFSCFITSSRLASLHIPGFLNTIHCTRAPVLNRNRPSLQWPDPPARSNKISKKRKTVGVQCRVQVY